MKRSSIFLFASFLSAFGDALLVCSVPYGLGAERADVRFAVIMWLFPAIAIFAAALFSPLVKKRESTARRDFGTILLVVAAIEIAFAFLLSDRSASSQRVLFLSSMFVILYAFTKEGIPRIFYNVAVYRFFFSENDFSKAAGLKASLDIAAFALGGFTAAYLISGGNWRLAFAVDAATFLVLGLTLLFAGRDNPHESKAQRVTSAEVQSTFPHSSWGHALIVPAAVAVLYGVAGIAGNYVPLVADQYGITSASMGIALLILFRLPGMVVGLKIQPIVQKIGAARIVFWVPFLSAGCISLFLAFPNQWSLGLSFVVSGIVIGLYNPADIMLRNSLPSEQMFELNAFATSAMALSQFVGCMVAMVAFSGIGKIEPRLVVLAAIPLFIALVFTSTHFIARRVLLGVNKPSSKANGLLVPLFILALMIASATAIGRFVLLDLI